jgi:hypothetical protein
MDVDGNPLTEDHDGRVLVNATVVLSGPER